jgi:hypothetical protein
MLRVSASGGSPVEDDGDLRGPRFAEVMLPFCGRKRNALIRGCDQLPRSFSLALDQVLRSSRALMPDVASMSGNAISPARAAATRRRSC